MGKRELAGLDLDLVITTGRRGGALRRDQLSMPPPPPRTPRPRVQSDEEIKQRNLKIFTESLGEMEEEAKKDKISYWILNYNAKKNNNDEVEDAGKNEDEQQAAQSKDTDKNVDEEEQQAAQEDDEDQQPEVELKDTSKNGQDDEEEMAAKGGDNEQESKKDTSGTELHAEMVEPEANGEETEDVHVETVDSESDDEEKELGSEDTDSDGSSFSGSSVGSDDSIYKLEKQRRQKKFDDALLKQKETEEYWSSMQQKPKHPKLPTQFAKSVVKEEPAKKKPAKNKRKKPEGDDEEEGRKRKPQVKRAPGEAASKVKHQLDHQVREALFGVVNPMKTTMNMSTPYMMTDEYREPERWTEEEAAAFRTEKKFPKVKFAVVCFTEQQPNANGGGGESGGVLGFNRFHVWTGSAKNSQVWAPVLKPLEKTCHPMLHTTCDEFHSSVFGAPPIKRARARKVVKLVARDGHPALVGKRAKPQQYSGQQNLGDNQRGEL